MRSLHAASSLQLRDEMEQCSEGIKQDMQQQKDADMENLKAILHEKLAHCISGIEDNMQFFAGA